MAKSNLIATILEYVPAPRGRHDEAWQNLESLPEERLTDLLATVKASAAKTADIVSGESLSKASSALASAAHRLHTSNTKFEELNRRLKARHAEQVSRAAEHPLGAPAVDPRSVETAGGWEAPFTPVHAPSREPEAEGLVESIVTQSTAGVRQALTEALVALESSYDPDRGFSERFRQFLVDAVRTQRLHDFLRARTTSLLLEIWELVCQPGRAVPLEPADLAMLRHIRNEVAHKPTVYDPLVLAETADVVWETRAIDSLAIMKSRMIDYQPDLLVSLDRGGEIVGRFLHEQFRNEVQCEYATVLRNNSGIVESLRRQQPSNKQPDRVIIVDDISRSGEAIAAAMRFVHEQYAGAEVRSMVLVGTDDAQARLGDAALYMPNRALNRDVRVPWGNKGYAFRHVRDTYVLGAEENALELTQDIFDKTVRRVRENLPK